MLLNELIEEIQEKAPNYLSLQSIIRKINSERGQLLRLYGTDVVPMQMDLLAGQGVYPWPYPAGSIQHVLVSGVAYPMGQLNSLSKAKYYYFLAGSIGIYPVPEVTETQGLTILYKKSLVPLSLNDLDADVGFDPDYDMLIAYGVLKDITNGSTSVEYTAKYGAMLDDYLRASTSPEAYQIPEVRW